jgi:hypothetical protein
MKKLITPFALALVAMVVLSSGCIVVSLGGGSKTETAHATTGQQLTDLKKARDNGAITEEEYQAQKAKLLQNK